MRVFDRVICDLAICLDKPYIYRHPEVTADFPGLHTQTKCTGKESTWRSIRIQQIPIALPSPAMDSTWKPPGAMATCLRSVLLRAFANEPCSSDIPPALLSLRRCYEPTKDWDILTPSGILPFMRQVPGGRYWLCLFPHGSRYRGSCRARLVCYSTARLHDERAIGRGGGLTLT